MKVVSATKLVILFLQPTHFDGIKQNNRGKCLKLDGKLGGYIVENLKTLNHLFSIN